MNNLSLEFIRRHSSEAARIIETANNEEQSQLLASIPPEAAAILVHAMIPGYASQALATMGMDQAIAILNHLAPNIASICIRKMPADTRNVLIESAVSNGLLAKVLPLLEFPTNTCGAIMNTRALILPRAMTVGKARDFIQASPDQLEDLLYIVDGRQKLLGYMHTRNLLIHNDDTPLDRLLHTSHTSLAAHAGLEAAMDNPGWARLESLPVVDNQGILLGTLNRHELGRLFQEYVDHGQHNEQPRDILLGLAETFVNACTDILITGNRKP